jgi:RNA polymerase sigma factor (sigma-70 family)
MKEPKEWKDWLRNEQYEVLFNVLVENFTEPLYWQARKLLFRHDLADDALQESFISVWKALPKFKGEANFYTWMFRITCNQCFATLKKESRYTEIDGGSLAATNEDPYFNGDKALLDLHKAIAKLPSKQQIVFKLRYFEEMTYSEMSSALETSEGALKASYHHAKEKIMKSFALL